MTVHRLKGRKGVGGGGQICRTTSLLPPLERFRMLTLVDLEAGPPTQVAGKHRQQKISGAGTRHRGPEAAGRCEVPGRGLQARLG